MICTGLPRNEDFGCSNAPKVDLDDTNQGVWDHRNYFGVEVISQSLKIASPLIPNPPHMACEVS